MQVCDPRILKLRNRMGGKGLWPKPRELLFSYVSLGVRRSILIFALGTMRLQGIVEGMWGAIARSKPPMRELANGFYSLLAVRS